MGWLKGLSKFGQMMALSRTMRPRGVPGSLPVWLAACERRGNKLKGFNWFCLKAKSRMWPRMSYVCHIVSTSRFTKECSLDFTRVVLYSRQFSRLYDSYSLNFTLLDFMLHEGSREAPTRRDRDVRQLNPKPSTPHPELNPKPSTTHPEG